MKKIFGFKNDRVAWGACIWFGLMFVFAIFAIEISFWLLVPEIICIGIASYMLNSWLEKKRENQ